MAINPENISTIRVDQLANLGVTLESLFPHTVGTELTSSPISDLVTLVANAIESTEALGFLPISVTDGQQLPDVPTTPGFFLAGAGTYLNVNGFPNLVCTENLNVIMTVDDHWEIAVQIAVNPLTGSVQSVTGSAVDNTDPLNPVINLSGATPDLQAVTDVGNSITDGTDTNTVSASGISVTDGTDSNTLDKTNINISDFINTTNLSKFGIEVSEGSNQSALYSDKLRFNSIDYPLPTGASSPLATLADITGGVTDGDKGDITVSGSGTVWTVDNQAITRPKLEHIQTGHVLGRHAAGTGDVQEVSPTQLRTILNVQDGAQVNNISDTNATDLTDGGNTTLHTHDSRYYTETEIDGFLASKQNTLVSGTNIKTLEGQSLLGSGNIDLSKSDVGLGNVDNTSDANKPVSTAQQTQFDLRVRTLLNDNVDSSAITGVTANTIIKSYLIPANTLAVGDTIDFKSVVSVTGINATKVLRLATNTSNSLTSALTLATLSAAAANRYLSLDRTYTLKTGNVLQSFPTGSSAVTDESTVTNPPDSTTFNPAVDNWFLIAIQPNSASDSFLQTLCYITLMKQKTTV